MTPFSCLGALKRRPEHGSVQNLELNVRFFPFRERTRLEPNTELAHGYKPSGYKTSTV
jgi:hypothetical protein